jgi:3-hydroxyisobutyrate dehydrogenase
VVSAPGDQAAEVDWLGYGRMGEAMVARLLGAGHRVAVWNRTQARVAGVSALGGTLLEQPAQSTAPVVFSMVSDDAALDALAVALTAAPSVPRVWVDCSTVSLDASQRAASHMAERGVELVCAPVSGNPDVVRNGEVIFAVSGPPDAITRARPFLDAIGPHTYVVGDAHQARVVKLCTNAVLATITQVLAETLVLGEISGVHRGALMDFINASAVGSRFTRYKTGALVGLDLAPTFTPEGLHKDLRLARDLAEDRNVPVPVVSVVEAALSRLVDSGMGAGLDFAALLMLAARDAGVTLEPESA